MSTSPAVLADAWSPPATRLVVVPPTETSLSVVIPATDRAATLDRCLAAIAAALDPPEEVIVVDRPYGAPPAPARNQGVRDAGGDVIVFIDADVEIHGDTFRRIRAAFASDSGLTAVFGSYDDDPAAPDVVSQFRNLLHHHVHQVSGGPVDSFWAGLGAIRRDEFLAAGGFAEHPIEDIELGMRLAAAGKRVVLDPSVLGKHLKQWTLWSMIRTDLLIRGAPWVALAIRHRSSPTVLNLGWRHRLSAATAVASVGALALRRPARAVGGMCLLIGLNRSFYALLLRRRGPTHAAAGIALHVLHHLVSAAAIPTGVAMHLRRPRDGTE